MAAGVAKHGRGGDAVRLVGARVVFFLGAVVWNCGELKVLENLSEVVSIVVGGLLVFDGKHKVRDRVFGLLKKGVGVVEQGVRKVKGDMDMKGGRPEVEEERGRWGLP